MWEKGRKNYLGPLQGDKNHSQCGNESHRAGSWCGQRSLGRFLQDLGMAAASQSWDSSAWAAFPSQEKWDCTSRVNPAGNKQLPPDSWLREGQGGSCSLSGAFQIKFAAGMNISLIWGGTGSSASRICVERRGLFLLDASTVKAGKHLERGDPAQVGGQGEPQLVQDNKSMSSLQIPSSSAQGALRWDQRNSQAGKLGKAFLPSGPGESSHKQGLRNQIFPNPRAAELGGDLWRSPGAGFPLPGGDWESPRMGTSQPLMEFQVFNALPNKILSGERKFLNFCVHWEHKAPTHFSMLWMSL